MKSNFINYLNNTRMKIKFTHLTMLGLTVLLAVNVKGQISNTNKQIVADTTRITAAKSTVGGGTMLLGYAWDMNGNSIYYNGGNIGIGTNSPAYPFEVNQNYSGWLTRFCNTANNSRAYFSNSTGNGAFISAGNNSTASTYALYVKADNYTDPFLYIRGDGKTGISNSAPEAQLHISGDGNIKLSRPSWSSFEASIGLSTYNGPQGLRFVTYPTGVETNFVDALFIASDGRVGVGTTNPRSGCKLHISGGYGVFMERPETASFANTKVSFGISTNSGIPGLRFAIANNGNWSSTVDVLHLANNAKVGIGTTNPTAKLTVNGDILCEKVRVIADVPTADYVFQDNYELNSIDEVKEFIQTNKHLPNVPSADEFINDGYTLGEMDNMLLEKIEEQMLYIIELNQRIQSLEAQLKAVE